MFGPTRSALLSTLLLAAALVPSGALGSVQHSWMPLDKRGAVLSGSGCYREYATDPQNCPIVHVAFFEDTACSKPLELVRTTPHALIKGNEQMIFDGTVAHSLKRPFGSLRVLAAVKGIGIGFAKQEESDMVVQNTAWMSSADTWAAFEDKACVTLPNLEAGHVGVWTAKFDSIFNVGGYVWNPDNIPINKEAPQCKGAAEKRVHHRRSSKTGAKVAQAAAKCKPVCLEPASYGGGGVLLLYTTDNCTPDPKDPKSVQRQLFSTVQCTPLARTNFKSYKAIQPQGLTLPTIFSPTYYDLGETDYHACAKRDVDSRPFKPNECQKMAGNDMFVGVYGDDMTFPQPNPGPQDKVLLQSHGHLLLSPSPKPPKHRRR
ncbi:uncharacterized protein SRS1_11385 [Sporisorium reilianum f. sp. reilianum]|uniref:Uncharacterized protein n=1 Tax=Sporisorium reilianum f. sp. reilianum TaxID=72559 RepID=A0A2N8U5V0_9BASI|nr:uncharacterized protein SRS1_11385 [Sporisorium reilianum f. sp. reilianum]